MPNPNPTITIQRPTPGRIVLYQNDVRGGFGYALPALVAVTVDNLHLHEQAVKDGFFPPLTDPSRVHLLVTGAGSGAYYEFDVPWSGRGAPRSWRYPEAKSQHIVVTEPAPEAPAEVEPEQPAESPVELAQAGEVTEPAPAPRPRKRKAKD